MATESRKVFNLGKVGVIVDSDQVHTTPGALTKAQNMHRDPLGSAESIVSRQGLAPFTTDDTAGSVLGGIGVPLRDRYTGLRFFFIGRGQVLA